MNVFILSQGADTGGQAQRTAAAFRKLRPDVTINAMVAGDTYIRFPQDRPWDDREARRLYDEADVVHHMNWLVGYAMHERGQHKPAIVHHHGPPLRSHPAEVNREARSIGATQIVATVDLLEQAPAGTRWIPGFFDLDWIRRTFPRKRSRADRLRIGHGPTVRAVKGTDAILAAVDAVASRMKQRQQIELDLVEGVDWLTSLDRKAECDIWIDQLTLGYGGSAIESMAMGIPTISGWERPEHRELFTRETRSTLPFWHATEADIEEAVDVLISREATREGLTMFGTAFVDYWHSEATGVRMLADVYTDAATRPTTGVNDLRLWSGPADKRALMRKWSKRR